MISGVNVTRESEKHSVLTDHDWQTSHQACEIQVGGLSNVED